MSANLFRRRGLPAAGVLALLTTSLAFVASPARAAPVTVSILGTNDFHGRLLSDRDIPGAAKYAGAVEQLRSENPSTLFAAAGDLIGATTFESFINQDKPTIDVLNEMQLDVSAVGNHELDKGYDDLVGRVMAPESDSNPKGGAEWQYTAANLDEPGDADLIPPSYTRDVAGVTVGFVGAVTEDLPSLVSPDGIEGLTVTDIVESTNAEADRLVAEDGADVVVLLVHEGAPGTSCATMADPGTAFGEIVTGVDADIDAIISGHTHLAYDCTLPKPGGAGTRPVVSAGQYGAFLNKLDFTVDGVTGEVAGVQQSLLDVNTGAYPQDPEVQAIVDRAKADAEGPGSAVLGTIDAPFKRAQRPSPTETDPGAVSENRGAESTLGNEVAEVQRWATGSQIAFMNPGGLRADMVGVQDADPSTADTFPTDLTYKQAAVVQPFANTLVSMDMTGAQIETLLEQQWQPAGSSRPFLKLGVSDGCHYTYDPDAAPGQRVGRIVLDGRELEPTTSYSVTANSFLAAGGDNFAVFRQATDRRDTGQVDLEAMVDYMERFASGTPLSPDFAQRAVGVRYGPADARSGVEMRLSSLAMTGRGDLQDDSVVVRLGNRPVGTAAVDNVVRPSEAFDESGRATVQLRTPPRLGPHERWLTVVGTTTGTEFQVPVPQAWLP